MKSATATKTLELYPLWPRQHEAVTLIRGDVEEMLYGGEAGGGKSYLLRALATGMALETRDLTIVLFRRTYPELHETHIKACQAELPPQLGKYSDERHEWRYPNGSVLEFRYCESDNDVYRYQSAEWDALLFDEATHFSEHQIRYLRSRVRSTKPGWRPKIVYASNPGNVGHAYFKAAFVDPAPAGEVFTAPADDGGARRVFLKARLSDNPSLGADYKRKLEGIKDESLRRALMNGDWDVFSGQVFREWNRDLHVCAPFTIPRNWPRWMGIDYGYNDPLVALWFAQAPDKRIYVYREWHESGVVHTEQAKKIATLSADERIGVRFADPSMWNKQANGVSIASVYAEWGVPIVKANNDRIPGLQRIHAALAVNPDTHRPSVQIFDACLNLIRTLPALTYDERAVEDVNTKADDHDYDALRYGLMGSGHAQPLPPPVPYTNASTQATPEWSPFAVNGNGRH